MNRICETCDTRLRLGLCGGENGEFKYCYRKIGNLNGLKETIIPFNSVDELYPKISDGFAIQAGSLVLKEYGDVHIGILVGKFEQYKGTAQDKEYPFGFIIK